MNSKPAWVTQVVATFIVFALMLMACATAPVSSPMPWSASPSPDLLAQGANIEATRAAGQALADAALTQIALANAQGIQVAAQLTATAVAATQAWQATEHALAVQQTEQAIVRFNADATATASSAQTADAFVLIVRISNLTSTAQAERTSTTQAQMAATATQHVIGIVTAAALATAQARAAREAQTALFWTWFPVVALTLLVSLAFVFAWRMLRVLETRQRIIQQQHGGPLIILEQKRSLTEYLPRVLSWLAWFLESNTVVVDPDRNVHPVTVIQDGTALSPTLTELPSQERTTARDQAVLLAAALPDEHRRRQVMGVLSSQAALDEASQTLPAEVIDGEVRVVEPDDVQPWLDELRQKLLTGGHE